MLRNVRFRLLNIEFCRCDRSWHFENVNSPFSRLYLVTAGESRVRHHGREYRLTAGTQHLIPCFTTHDCHCPDWFELYFLHFTSEIGQGSDLFAVQEYECHRQAGNVEFERFGRLLELNPNKKLDERDPTKPTSKNIYTYRYDNEHREALCDRVESQALLRLLLVPILREAHVAPEEKTIRARRRFDDVLAHIDTHLSERIALADLAAVASLETNYFSRRFHQTFGVRPVEYINRRRIERAQSLLLFTNDNQDRIAKQVGFSDWAYLSRVFRKYIGISPGRYRQQNLLA